MLHPFKIDTFPFYVNSITMLATAAIFVEYLPVNITGIGVYGVKTIAVAPDDCLRMIWSFCLLKVTELARPDR